jgi:hypothetical protein
MSRPLEYATSQRQPRQWLKYGVNVSLTIAVCVTLGLGVGLDLHERFLTAEIPDTAARYTAFDSGLERLDQASGFFLHFAGFTSQTNWIPLDYYSRAVYSVYPKRVLVADPNAPIFDFNQLAAANFDPDGQWLLDHGTPVEATYTLDPQTGNIAALVQQVSGGPAAAR